jgi:hypothetical protein
MEHTMNRHFALALVLAAAGTGTAFADDITVDPHPFVSTLTRAQVREDLRQFRASGVNPWADDYTLTARFDSGMSRAEAKAAFLAWRESVGAFSAEDSGSMYLARTRPAVRRPVELARTE